MPDLNSLAPPRHRYDETFRRAVIPAKAGNHFALMHPKTGFALSRNDGLKAGACFMATLSPKGEGLHHQATGTCASCARRRTATEAIG